MYAFITGASSGIGRDIALLLARKGYDLILVARREERLKHLRHYLKKTHHSLDIRIEQCDLSVPAHCIEVYRKYESYPVEVVINSAGFGKVGYVTDLSLDIELSMINTNITAAHLFTKLFSCSMQKGYILNIASIAGFQPGPFLSAYSATKSYLLNFSLSVNYELKKQKKDIHITTLCPGPVRTEFNAVAGADFMMTSISSKKCAKIALKGLFSKKNLVIPGILMKLTYLLSKLSPYFLILPAEYIIQTKKRNQFTPPSNGK